jgi:hypothetical protein
MSAAGTTLLLACFTCAFVSCVSQWGALHGSDFGLQPAAPSPWAEELVGGLCLIGAVLSAAAALLPTRWRATPPLRAVVLALCTAAYAVILQTSGRPFFSFQWDLLLVEAGTVGALLCVLPQAGGVLARWLLFKLMMQSGVVKLQAGCPLWHGLTATQVHYASQCLPTAGGYYAHNAPTSFQSLSVAVTLFIEIPASLLLLWPASVPAVLLSSVGVWVQLTLQALIMLTGNYGFFNLLTCALCLCALPSPVSAPGGRPLWAGASRGWLLQCGALALGSWCCWSWMFVTKTHAGLVRAADLPWWHVLEVDESSRLASPAVVTSTLSVVLPAAFAVASLDFIHASAREAVGALSCSLSSPLRLAWRLACLAGAALLFTSSSHHLLLLEPATLGAQSPVPAAVQDALRISASFLARYPLTNSYGLFRSMTGAGAAHRDGWGRAVVDTARPELVLEGQFGDEWRELELPFKPGDPRRPPAWLLGTMPRLDWQMWFAALGSSVGDAPWLLSLVRGLLAGSPSAYSLIDTDVWPAVLLLNYTGGSGEKKRVVRYLLPPTAIRVSRWVYDFSPAPLPWVARTIRMDGTEGRLGAEVAALPQSQHPLVRSLLRALGAGSMAADAAPSGAAPWWVRRREGEYLPALVDRDERLVPVFIQLHLPATLSVPMTATNLRRRRGIGHHVAEVEEEAPPAEQRMVDDNESCDAPMRRAQGAKAGASFAKKARAVLVPLLRAAACVGRRAGLLPAFIPGHVIVAGGSPLVHLSRTAHESPLWLLVGALLLPTALQAAPALARSCAVCRAGADKEKTD